MEGEKKQLKMQWTILLFHLNQMQSEFYLASWFISGGVTFSAQMVLNKDQ